MENIFFNELKIRDFNVDVDVAVVNGSNKMEQEKCSLVMTGDAFKRIIITKEAPTPYYNDSGVLYECL